MTNTIYPAIFHKAEEGGYWVEFPDLGCVTQGDTIEEALNMAGDLLMCYLDNANNVNSPSDISTIKVQEGDFVSLIKPQYYESDEARKFKTAEAIENGLTARKLNKNQAALILGVDRSYFTYLANGKKTPAPDMAKRIGLLLGFDWQIFYAE